MHFAVAAQGQREWLATIGKKKHRSFPALLQFELRFAVLKALSYCDTRCLAGYVTPGLTFEQLNKRLYDASINTQLDEIFEAVMTGKSTTAPDSEASQGSFESEELPESKPAARAVGVAKSAKVAGFLVLALLLQARALLCGF